MHFCPVWISNWLANLGKHKDFYTYLQFLMGTSETIADRFRDLTDLIFVFAKLRSFEENNKIKLTLI